MHNLRLILADRGTIRYSHCFSTDTIVEHFTYTVPEALDLRMEERDTHPFPPVSFHSFHLQ